MMFSGESKAATVEKNNARRETRQLPRTCSVHVRNEVAVGGITESTTENFEPGIAARSTTATVAGC
jgi:hypothetical protein